MTVRDLKAMEIVLAGDSLDRLEKSAFDRLLKAEGLAKQVADWPEFRDFVAELVLDAEALCAEFGALGKEC